MTARRWWVAAALVTLVACGGGSASELTPPRPPAPGRHPPASTMWGPVVAPAPLVAVARAYYGGAGPAPEDQAEGRPACDLLLPTAAGAPGLQPVPTSRFNVFGEFVVRWAAARSQDAGLTFTVYPAGDPADRRFFGPDAQRNTLPDGSELRTTPSRPRASLVRILGQNCEYELAPRSSLATSEDAGLLDSLRLVYAP